MSRSADVSCRDKRGYTPLHAASASGHIDVVKYLLRLGAEVGHWPSSSFLPQTEQVFNMDYIAVGFMIELVEMTLLCNISVFFFKVEPLIV